ncbi:chorion peroxidase-like [Anopheles nili]|uniref:chorion peroxidase-like n=1 Tax=Anopheles nili TaxID=185578 RepID=UPI00237A1F8D|nr:chorion peroxidase-like [Anopheles nili]
MGILAPLGVLLVFTADTAAAIDGGIDSIEKAAGNATITGTGVCAPGSACVRLLQCPEVDRMALVRYLSRPPHLRSPADRRWKQSVWHRCPMADGTFIGICCPEHPASTEDEPSEPSNVSAPSDENLLRTAERIGSLELQRFLAHDQRTHGHTPLPVDAIPPELVWEGLADVLTLQALQGLTNGTAGRSFRRAKRCLVGPPCEKPHSRYRRFDGRCNNADPGGSLWGSAGFPMERLLPPAYGDGVWAPRIVSLTGRYLPTARKLSSNLFADLHNPHTTCNVLLMQFGQFLAHDFSRNKPIAAQGACCHADGSGRVKDAPPGCMPIPVSRHDDFYAQHGVRCLQFVRTAVAAVHECNATPHARQLSAVSHFIDGSPIYGANGGQARDLRAFEGGRLRSLSHRHFHNELPPLDRTEGACDPHAKMCFQTGDVRSNQLVSLVAIHTLFLREHNRLARSLEQINPHWGDETLFQETRRIVIAQLQQIAFGEYLPKVVGPRYMELYGLKLAPGGSYSAFYNPKTNPSVSSEFTVAAFRFGHSTVPSQLDLPDGAVPTWRTFLDPTRFRERPFYDGLLEALQHQPMQTVDELFTVSLTRLLDVKPGQSHGVDLAAINIQRGRDHALRPYNDYRRLAGRSGAVSFEEYGPDLGPRLAALYAHPEDVDLYVGGILERPVDGGLVGETFAELIADQFAKFLHGDRYFYSNGPDSNPGHFTPSQLGALQRVTLAGLICANAGDAELAHVLPDAFALPHKDNARVPCSKVSRLDLSWWKD